MREAGHLPNERRLISNERSGSGLLPLTVSRRSESLFSGCSGRRAAEIPIAFNFQKAACDDMPSELRRPPWLVFFLQSRQRHSVLFAHSATRSAIRFSFTHFAHRRLSSLNDTPPFNPFDHDVMQVPGYLFSLAATCHAHSGRSSPYRAPSSYHFPSDILLTGATRAE